MIMKISLNNDTKASLQYLHHSSVPYQTRSDDIIFICVGCINRLNKEMLLSDSQTSRCSFCF